MTEIIKKQATYITHPNRLYRGNPFIEAIGFPLPLNEFMEAVNVLYTGELDLSLAPEHTHGYYQRTAIDELAFTYVVRGEAYRLYDKLLRMIEAGYVRRNPLSPEINRLLVAIEKDKKTPLDSMHINALDLVDAKLCTFVAGLSGAGKTTMFKHILKLLPPVITHTDYDTADNGSKKINASQAVYLYIEVHNRNTQKPVLKSILEALDSAIDGNYKYQYRNSSVPELITIIRKAVIIHGVGLIIIDEAQNLAKPSQSETIAASETISMKFIEGLFNRIGVPLCFIGTIYMLKLFGNDTTTTRRATTNGSLILLGCDVESKFWERFIAEMCQIKFLKNTKNQKMDLGLLGFHIHQLTKGIPAIASSLIRATLSFLTFKEPEEQYLSMAVLDKVFNDEFSILIPLLKAIKDKKYYKYDDLSPMSLLTEVESNLSKLEDGATMALDDSSISFNETDIEKSQKEVTFSKSKNAQEILDEKAKNEELLNTNNILSELGYREV